MEKAKINKGRMYQSTDLVLEKFAGLFNWHNELVAAHQQLKDGILLINAEQQVQVVDNRGLTQGKVSKREVLTQDLLKFSKGMKALATLEKNTDLLTKSGYLLSDLNRFPDPIFFDVGTMLLNLANPLRDKLTKFFITDEDFVRTEANLAEFRASIPQKRLATTVSKSSTKKLSEVFKTTDKLLKELIDVYMAPFEYAHPDFFREYSNARIIVGYTGRGKSKAEKVAANGEETPVV